MKTIFHEIALFSSKALKTRFHAKASKKDQPIGSHFNLEKG